MGWLFMQRLGSHKGPKDYLDAQFTYQNDQSQLRVLRSTLVNRRVYYAAAERILIADNTRSVFAIVCLVKWAPRARDGYIFGYKDMDESVGPCERDCPAGILDLLTPTEYRLREKKNKRRHERENGKFDRGRFGGARPGLSVELVARHGSLSIIERPPYQITPPVNGFAVSLVFDLKVLPR